jgi:outer membrane protein TolC
LANEGAVTAKQVDLQGMVFGAEEKQEELKTRIARDQNKLAALEKAFEAGLAPAFDVLEAQSELEAAKAELRIVRLSCRS